MAPKTSPRPKKRPADIEAMGTVSRVNSMAAKEGGDRDAMKLYGNTLQKKAKGGMCRGMGAAKKGGNFSKAG